MLWLLLFSTLASAQTLDPDAERIMELQFLEGTPIAEALSVYNQDNQWFFPLQEFSQALGLQINVSAELGQAEGFILREDRSFRLKSSPDGTCHVWIGKEERHCPKLIAKDKELWVSLEALESWFPLKLKLDSFGSRIDVESLEPFPVQSRLERERQAAMNLRRASDRDLGYPKTKISHKVLDGFSLDQQLSFARTKSPSTKSQEFSHDNSLSWETLGFESKAFVTGADGKLADPRLSFARRDPEGRLLGKLRASEIELLDYTMPSVNLVGGGGLSKGVQISSYPLSGSTEFRTTDLSGELPTGWEVELYQNGNLIGREASSNQGRYLFTGIPLEYGANQFRLLFYGPQGQRREEFKSFNIDSSIAKPGRASYRMSVGKIQEKSKPEATRTQVLWEKNLFGHLSFRGGWMHNIPEKEITPQPYYLTGLRGFYKGLFYYSEAAFTTNKGRAWETGLKEDIWGMNLGLSHTMLSSNFISDIFERQDRIKHQSKASAGFSLFSQPTIRLNFDFLRKVLSDHSSNFSLANRLSTQTGPLYWFNDLNYEWGDTASSWSGKLTNFFLWGETQVRLSGDYDKHHFTNAALLLQQNFSQIWSISAQAAEELQTKKIAYGLGLNRIFPWFTTSLTNSYNTDKEWSSSLLLSYNLTRDTVSNKLKISSQAQSTDGSANVFVFIDKNRNGKFDDLDEPLSNATITINQQDWREATGDDGRVFLSRLASYEAVDISLAIKSLNDPMLRPAQTGTRIYPRPGKTAEILIPVIYMGEASGTVRDAQGKAVPKQRILARDESGAITAEAISESDGFYLLTAMPSGNYTLEFAQTDIVPSPRNRKVSIPLNGGFIDNQDFQLSEK